MMYMIYTKFNEDEKQQTQSVIQQNNDPVKNTKLLTECHSTFMNPIVYEDIEPEIKIFKTKF